MRIPTVSRKALVVLVAIGIIDCLAPTARAYSPESDEVKAMVKRAITFIEDNYDEVSTGYYRRLGGTCLVGMTMYKYHHDLNHPLVEAAVERCQEVCRTGASWNLHSNYSVGLAVIFLAEVDAERFRPEIDYLVRELLNRQMANGAWSYAAHNTGDTSQTQYAVLAMWMAHHKQIDVPTASIVRVCDWLMRVQAPNGSWGYQGNDPGSYQRIPQDTETHSLAAAGLGSSYVCAELLGFITPLEEKQKSNLPSALRAVGEETKTGPITTKIPGAVLRQTLNKGNDWFDALRSRQAAEYQHYFMYALERYMSFRQNDEGSKESEPDWYNWGVEYLGKTQANNGSWSSCEAGPVIDSSFAVLFLLRSMNTTLRQLDGNSGVLQGSGNRLPPDPRNISKNSRGGIDSGQTMPTAETVIAELEKGESAYLDPIRPDALDLSSDPSKRAAQLARLRRLAMSGSYQARLTAVKTLGRDRNIDHFPVLIHALSDSDHRVIRAARNGLRYISRRVDGFGLQVADERPAKTQYIAAQDEWSRWYRGIRPNGVLIE